MYVMEDRLAGGGPGQGGRAEEGVGDRMRGGKVEGE